MHIRQDQCIQDRTKARELSGLCVTRSKALHRNSRLALVSHTWHIKAPKGNELQRSGVAGSGLYQGLCRALGVSELMVDINMNYYIVYTTLAERWLIFTDSISCFSSVSDKLWLLCCS